MKKIFFVLPLLLVSVFLMTSCEKEEVVDQSALPSTSSVFLQEHFAGVPVLSVVREKEVLSGSEYEVLLENRIKVKFDKDGVWDEVEAIDNTAGIPTSFIAALIVNYIASQYPSAGINSIEKEKTGFDVELTNGLDLMFDLEGNFLRIDP